MILVCHETKCAIKLHLNILALFEKDIYLAVNCNRFACRKQILITEEPQLPCRYHSVTDLSTTTYKYPR